MKLATVICFASAALAQSAPPSFEIASIKAHELRPGPLVQFSSSGPRVRYGAYPILSLVMEAYDVRREFVAFTSLPRDADSTYYEIEAKADGDAPRSRPEFRAMLQTLLAERFRLRVHWERREMPVYALVVGKSGAKLKASDGDAGPRVSVGVNGRNQVLQAKKMTMDELARQLGNAFDVNRPVVDRTGLTGIYDVRLEAAYASAPRSDPDAAGLSIFTAVQEQLGLKLEPAKASLDVLVIDHVERPSEN